MKPSYDLFILQKNAKKLWSLFNASWQIAIFCTIAVVIINFFLWFLIKAALSIRFLEQSLIIKKKKTKLVLMEVI